MNVNGVMLQCFEWYMPSGMLWNKISEGAEDLARAGFTSLWIPPAYKGLDGANEVGYAVYDLFDLGEFDQKGSVPTKYGTRDELVRAVRAAQEQGLEVYADVVLDHMMGADELETVKAEEYNPDNRLEQESGLEEIEVWTHFFFPGRNKKYSDFEWHWYHFTGIDYDDREDKEGVFKFRGKYWERQVDKENGNFDYLMGASLDLNHEEVRKELLKWGLWFVKTTGVDGFRLDAIKHMKFSFYNEWLDMLRSQYREELFTVGEYWSQDYKALKNYIDTTEGALSLFDVPLHFRFFEASKAGNTYDMRTIFNDTLTADNPTKSVTFVDNHDSQPGQALESWVQPWFKPLAYAMILLRRDGYPCVFYGDWFGIDHDNLPPIRDVLLPMMRARIERAHGEQHDYFDHANTIGWTREGDDEHPGSGLAVLLTNGDKGEKIMYVGKKFAKSEFHDLTGNIKEIVTIDDEGNGHFLCPAGSVSVWGRKERS